MPATRKKRAPVEESIVGTLMDIASRFQRQGERLAQEAGLTTQQWLLLLEIAGDPSFGGRDMSEGVLASDIARARGVTNANMSGLVAKLSDRGFIVQTADPEDGRRKRLTITDAGRDVVASLEPVRRQANRRFFRRFSAAERKTFLALLKRCQEGLED